MLYAALTVSSFHPVLASSDGFRSRNFLEMDSIKKKFWPHGSIMSYANIAAARDKDKGKCVYNWYFSDKIAERNGVILASMKNYPQVTPSAVILALLENACGEFRN